VKKMNQAKLLMGTLSLLVMAVIVSCTRNLSVPVTAVVNTPTATTTKTATPTNTSTGPTFTFTSTATLTFTSTQTNTATPTNTNTPTGPTATFTNTYTNTDTPTITNTGTNTDTPTITNTPTLTATFTNTFTNTNTPTPTNTVAGPPPTATGTPNPNVLFDNFDAGPWAGWTSGGGNGYMVSVYMQSGVFNNGTQNVSTTQNGTPGSLDLNVTFSATTGTLLEATIEPDYGTPLDETGGTGTNPTYLSYWINPTVTMTMAHIYIDAPAGTNTMITNTTVLPAGVWTNVVQNLSTVPAGNMSSTKAVILDMTSATATTVDVLYDEMYFYP